jgi:hypothetical protein
MSAEEATSTAICECGCDDSYWIDEITPSHPWGTGYVIHVCACCGREFEDDRYWVGF